MIEDIKRDGRIQVTFQPDYHSPLREIYAWNGHSLDRADVEFPNYSKPAISELESNALSRNQLPLSARISWLRDAVTLYLTTHEYTSALMLCDQVLRILDDRSLTAPNNVLGSGAEASEYNSRVMNGFADDLKSAKSEILRLKGYIYKTSGDSVNAEVSYKAASEARK